MPFGFGLESSLTAFPPHPCSSFATAQDPVPQALALLSRLLSQYRDLFTFIRSLPCVEAALHSLARSLFFSADYIPQQHDAALKAYEELAMVFPVARTNHEALRSKVDEHRRELGLVRGALSVCSLSERYR